MKLCEKQQERRSHHKKNYSNILQYIYTSDNKAHLDDIFLLIINIFNMTDMTDLPAPTKDQAGSLDQTFTLDKCHRA